MADCQSPIGAPNDVGRLGQGFITSGRVLSDSLADLDQGDDSGLPPDLCAAVQQYGRSRFLSGVKEGRGEADNLYLEGQMRNFRLERRLMAVEAELENAKHELSAIADHRRRTPPVDEHRPK